MPFSNFFFFLSRVNFAFRSFVLGTVFSSYVLVLYYFENQINLSIAGLSYLFVIPFIASSVILFAVPKKFGSGNSKIDVLQKKYKKTDSDEFAEQNQKQIISGISVKNDIENPTKLTPISEQEEKSGMMQEIGKNQPLPEIQEKISLLKGTVSDLDKKLSEFEKQLHEMKVTMQDLKRTGVIKNDTYESALTELKAFKSELDNPFNFINKYFEMLDIPGMYDPKSSIKSNGTMQKSDDQNTQKKFNIFSKKDPGQSYSDHPNKKHTKNRDKKKESILVSQSLRRFKDEKVENNSQKKSVNTESNTNNTTEKTIFRPKRVDVIG